MEVGADELVHGMVMDYDELADAVKPVVFQEEHEGWEEEAASGEPMLPGPVDHLVLNERPGLENPTTELPSPSGSTRSSVPGSSGRSRTRSSSPSPCAKGRRRARTYRPPAT